MSKRGDLAETQGKLANLRGQELTGKQLKEMFGYSPNTYIRDTFLYHEGLIEQVKGTSPTLWRVQSDLPMIQALPVIAGQTARRIVELVAHGEYTQQQLGDLVGVSHERVGQIIRQFGIHYKRPSRPSRKRCCIVCGEPLRKPYRKVKGRIPPCHLRCRKAMKVGDTVEVREDAPGYSLWYQGKKGIIVDSTTNDEGELRYLVKLRGTEGGLLDEEVTPPFAESELVRTKRVNQAEEIKDAVVRDYLRGDKGIVIQMEHKVSASTMYRILHERGVKLWQR